MSKLPLKRKPLARKAAVWLSCLVLGGSILIPVVWLNVYSTNRPERKRYEVVIDNKDDVYRMEQVHLTIDKEPYCGTLQSRGHQGRGVLEISGAEPRQVSIEPCFDEFTSGRRTEAVKLPSGRLLVLKEI